MQWYRLFRTVLTSSIRKPLIAVHSTYRNCSYLQKLVKKVNRSAHLNASVPRDASAALTTSPHQITYKVPWMIPVSSMLSLFCTNNNDYISCELNSVDRDGLTRAPNLCPFTLAHSTLDKLCANVRIILKWYEKMWVGGFRLERTLLVQDGCKKLTLVTLVRDRN
jgi:hypothetical protein